MKLWMKYLLAATVGVILGIYVFPTNESAFQNTEFAAQIVLHIGRYALFPLIFFSLAYGTFRLRMDRRTLPVIGKSFLIIAATAALLVSIGTGIVLAIAPERIPIIVETEVVHAYPSFKELIFNIFPNNLFNIFIGEGSILFPVVFFSLFLGLNFSFDKVLTRPVVQVFDSLTRIFYHIAKFVNELLGLGLVVLAAYFVVHLRRSEELELYSELLLLIGILTVFIIFCIYPILLYFLTGRQNPFKYLYAILAPSIAAFFSGNSYFSLVPLIPHIKENLGVPRKIGSVTIPLFALFAKAGTAMVSSITFIVILKSYSSLGIEFVEITWIIGVSIAASLLTSTVPGFGVAAALTALCTLYGRGIENGFLIIYPILPLLSSFAVFIDMVTVALGSLVVAYSEDEQRDLFPTQYI
ncbi:MAG: dicarboxylate/amino acid:cation symporter [Spirochaetota bacterium]